MVYFSPTCSLLWIVVMYFQHDIGIEIWTSNWKSSLLKQFKPLCMDATTTTACAETVK
jgi:hypothetical protein